MNATCYFCKREPGVEQCATCKRWVCIQCQDNHNCYAREGRSAASLKALTGPGEEVARPLPLAEAQR